MVKLQVDENTKTKSESSQQSKASQIKTLYDGLHYIYKTQVCVDHQNEKDVISQVNVTDEDEESETGSTHSNGFLLDFKPGMSTSNRSTKDYFCCNCKTQMNVIIYSKFQKSAFAWSLIFLISGGFMWCWVPFCLSDFMQEKVKCLICGEYIKYYEAKLSPKTEKFLLGLLILDFVLLASYALYNTL